MNFEQESNVEQSINLEKLQSPQIRETGEMSPLTNSSEMSINLEESNGCTYINEIENENFQEGIFEHKESTEMQLSNEYSDKTTKLLHENNGSALSLFS